MGDEQQAVPVAQEAANFVKRFKAEIAQCEDNTKSYAPYLESNAAIAVDHIERLLASLPCKSGEGAGDSGYKAHFERMQDMMRRYIEPITYVASFPADSTKHASEFEEPGPHDSSTNSESKRRRMDRAFISDMIHMMDGPEQRALALTPDATQTREAEGEWVMIPREPTEAMRFAAAAADTRLEIWSSMLSASPTPPALSDDLRECLDQAHALIQEAKGLAGDGAVTDHLDFAEHWLGKIEVSQTLTTVSVNALREAAHDLVSTASHHGSHAAIDQDKINCLRDAVSDFDAALNARGGA